MLRGWYAHLIERWDTIRGSYWFFPAQMTVLAAVAALVLVEVDEPASRAAPETFAWLGKVTADSARSVLSTIAGSMMTVTGVVFSITVVALTLASSQFGPRLLRTFFRDRGSQAALGTFLATFLFNLLVLRAVENAERVPVVATAVAVALAVLSLFVLIYFIHHSASSIQASSVIAAVACEIDEQIPSLFPEQIGREPDGASGVQEIDEKRLAALEEDADEIRASQEGYIRVIDDESLLCIAEERDLLIRIDARPGDFSPQGGTVARVAPASRASADDLEQIARSFVFGDHRTPVQDLAFSIEQLAQMAVRAMSPGINDPGTAVACIHRLGGLMFRLSDRSTPSGRRLDTAGRLRVIVRPTRFGDIAACCFDSIRRYGSADPDVAVALLEAVAAGVGRGGSPERREILEAHAGEIQRAFAESGSASQRDRSRVESAFALCAERLAQSGA